jgi:hypothetical protein
MKALGTIQILDQGVIEYAVEPGFDDQSIARFGAALCESVTTVKQLGKPALLLIDLTGVTREPTLAELAQITAILKRCGIARFSVYGTSGRIRYAVNTVSMLTRMNGGVFSDRKTALQHLHGFSGPNTPPTIFSDPPKNGTSF